MDVRDALLLRKSVRAFLDKPVSGGLIESLLDAARHAPSGAKTQIWQVAVVTGSRKQEAGNPAGDAGEIRARRARQDGLSVLSGNMVRALYRAAHCLRKPAL